jgi:hypothetical protein
MVAGCEGPRSEEIQGGGSQDCLAVPTVARVMGLVTSEPVPDAGHCPSIGCMLESSSRKRLAGDCDPAPFSSLRL